MKLDYFQLKYSNYERFSLFRCLRLSISYELIMLWNNDILSSYDYDISMIDLLFLDSYI